MSARKILVADDDPYVLEIVQQELSGAGYRTIAAADGLEVLRKVRLDTPDLVVLNSRLPGLDCRHVLRTIEADPDTAGLPVILLLPQGQEEDVVQGLQDGAIDYLTKPFFPENLAATVRILLDVFDSPMRQQWRSHLIAKHQLMGRPDRGVERFSRDPGWPASERALLP